MNKKQSQWIALFVTLAFFWLLRVSAMPVAAASVPDQIAAADSERAPVYMEEEGNPGLPARKKSILPLILGVAAAGAVAAVLVLVVFKTKYDIRGTWNFDYVSTSPAHTWTWTLTFTGDSKQSGGFTDAGDTGTYKVDGKNVTIKYNAPWDTRITISEAKFDSKDKMSGRAAFAKMTIGSLDIPSASWTAVRAVIPAAAAKPQAFAGKKTRR